jgi:hypothetical protein
MEHVEEQEQEDALMEGGINDDEDLNEQIFSVSSLLSPFYMEYYSCHPG